MVYAFDNSSTPFLMESCYARGGKSKKHETLFFSAHVKCLTCLLLSSNIAIPTRAPTQRGSSSKHRWNAILQKVNGLLPWCTFIYIRRLWAPKAQRSELRISHECHQNPNSIGFAYLETKRQLWRLSTSERSGVSTVRRYIFNARIPCVTRSFAPAALMSSCIYNTSNL